MAEERRWCRQLLLSPIQVMTIKIQQILKNFVFLAHSLKCYLILEHFSKFIYMEVRQIGMQVTSQKNLNSKLEYFQIKLKNCFFDIQFNLLYA